MRAEGTGRAIEGAGLAAAIAGVAMLTLAFVVGLAAPQSHASERDQAAYVAAGR